MRQCVKWTNIDLRFNGICGYPKFSLLCGSHFTGITPWHFKKEKVLRGHRRSEDFRLWYTSYIAMVTEDYPELLENRGLQKLLTRIEGLLGH